MKYKNVKKQPRSRSWLQNAGRAAATWASNPANTSWLYKQTKRVAKSQLGREPAKRRKLDPKKNTLSQKKVNSPTGFEAIGARVTRNQTIYMGPHKGGRAANIQYDHHFNKIIENVPGRQGVDWPNLIMANQYTTALNSIGYTASRNSDRSYGTDLFQLTPKYKGLAGIYPNDGDPTIANDEVFVNYVHSTMNLTNFTTASAEVTILWMAPVNHNEKNPIESWQQILNEAANGQTIMTTSALLDTVAATVTPGAYDPATGTEQHGQEPQFNKEFKRLWNIKKRNKYQLGAGDTINLNTKVVYNKTLKKRYHQETSSIFVSRWTLVPLIIVRAAPTLVVLDAAENVAYGEAKIGFLHHQRLVMSMVGNKRIKTMRAFNPIIQNWNQATHTMQHINEDGNADVVEEAGNDD